MNMKKPKLEEFMIFEDERGKQGVIIKKVNHSCKWWMCYVEGGGQVFNESLDHSCYNRICKLYKVREEEYIHFYSLSFMKNGDLSGYNCIYDSTKPKMPDINEVSERLYEIGIKVKYPDGVYKSFNVIMEEMSKQWDSGYEKEVIGALFPQEIN